MTDDPLARRVEARNRLRDVDFPSSAAMADASTTAMIWTDWSTADLIAMTAHDLDAIVVATVGCWSPETRAGVLRTLLEDAALRIYGWPDGKADTLCLAVPLVSVTCDEPLTGAVRCDALVSLLSPLPADAREDTHDGK